MEWTLCGVLCYMLERMNRSIDTNSCLIIAKYVAVLVANCNLTVVWTDCKILCNFWRSGH